MFLDQHEQLLDRWAMRPHHQGKPFIKDGIIDLERWNKTPRKLLFLLKEAYGESEAVEGFDLRELIREEWKGPKYKIWWLIARWCYGIQNATQSIPQLSTEGFECKGVQDALLSAGVINIKKSGGRSTSDDTEPKEIVRLDGDLIHSQVDMISPNILICGSVWDIVRHLWPSAKPLYDLVFQDREMFIVDFWHPSNHFPNLMNYYTLLCLLQQAGAFSKRHTNSKNYI